jgi:Uma2 family endonuclease
MMQPMPRVPPLDRPATYEDLVALDEIFIAEIMGGELYGTRRLPPRHSIASSRLGLCLDAAASLRARSSSQWWIFRGVEVHIGDDVVVPDWAAWRRHRFSSFPAVDYFSEAPDWICEVLTPQTVVLDRAKKLAIYAREGVSHAWLIDPLARTLEVLRLENGRWTILGTHAGTEVVRAEPFSDIELELSSLWAD